MFKCCCWIYPGAKPMPMYQGFLSNDKYVTKNKTHHKIIVCLKDEFNETAQLLLCIEIAKCEMWRRVHILFDAPTDVRASVFAFACRTFPRNLMTNDKPFCPVGPAERFALFVFCPVQAHPFLLFPWCRVRSGHALPGCLAWLRSG